MVSRGQGQGEWEGLVSGCRVSFWYDENVLNLDAGAVCTTL